MHPRYTPFLTMTYTHFLWRRETRDTVSREPDVYQVTHGTRRLYQAVLSCLTDMLCAVRPWEPRTAAFAWRQGWGRNSDNLPLREAERRLILGRVGVDGDTAQVVSGLRNSLSASARCFLCNGVKLRCRDGLVRSASHSSAHNSSADFERAAFDVVGEASACVNLSTMRVIPSRGAIAR